VVEFRIRKNGRAFVSVVTADMPEAAD
jgi:hypothetical protein